LRAHADYVCRAPVDAPPSSVVEVPPLFAMYLSMGARVCSEPAIDRAFRTIDYLVLFDLADLDERSRRRFLPSSGHDA
jgi:putative hemolysin